MSETFAAGAPDELHRRFRLAVLGSPIAHSRSPLLHRTAYAALGLPWSYDAQDVTGERLPGFVDRLTPEWRGLSLTMPLKEQILPLLDSIDTVARTSGAVNTVLVDWADGCRTLAGFNTDVYGLRQALERAGITTARRVMVIGGGATARSAVVAAAQSGAEHVDVVLRSPEKAGGVVETARAAGVSSDVVALDDQRMRGLEPDLTISTLPGGVGAAAHFTDAAAPRSSTLLDVAYHPWPSELASVWDAAGSAAVPGLAMLAHQAVAQIRVFVHGDPLLPLDGEDRVTAAMLVAIGLDGAGRLLD
ncbi:shikimate dehydrogenase [Herbiconiux sp. P18]|uniref:shikimate dehydrogenase n=1 Tax=Herbiconiux liangxiaofengii TaxID=3342795 RepID=UPI0035B9EFD0